MVAIAHPHDARSVLLLSDAHRQATLEELRQNYEDFVWAETVDDAAVRRWRTRSPVNKACELQLASALRDADWQVSRTIEVFLRKKFTRTMSTQQNEDGFMRLRRLETRSGHKRPSMPAVFQELIDTQVLETVHRYEPIVLGADITMRNASLPTNAFQIDGGEQSLKSLGAQAVFGVARDGSLELVGASPGQFPMLHRSGSHLGSGRAAGVRLCGLYLSEAARPGLPLS